MEYMLGFCRINAVFSLNPIMKWNAIGDNRLASRDGAWDPLATPMRRCAEPWTLPSQLSPSLPEPATPDPRAEILPPLSMVSPAPLSW